MGSFAKRHERPTATAPFSLSPTRAIRIGEKTERHQAVACVSRAPVEVGLDNTEVILRDVREMRAACAFAQSPDAGRCGFEPFVYLNVSTRVESYAGFVQPYVLRIGSSASGHKNIAPFKKRSSRRRSELHTHGIPGRAFDLRDLHIQSNIDAIETKKFQKSTGNIFVLARKQLWPTLQDSHTASKTDEGLPEFQPT